VFVAELLQSIGPAVQGFEVTLHDKIAGADGTYDFDATVRFDLAGMQFLVLVEAKRHSNPVKRELVQVLHTKVQGVGAQKGVMISTAPYQSGAVEFAAIHGIALATVTEGRFTFETRVADPVPPLSRTEAFERYGVPTYVGRYYQPMARPGAFRPWTITPDTPDYVLQMLTGPPATDDQQRDQA